MAVDSSDNVYIGGYTSGNLTRAPSAGSYDIWLAKYDSSGTQQWIVQFGTSTNAFFYSNLVESTDTVYFGGQTNGALTGSNAGLNDIWYAQYNSSGTQQWIVQFGTSSSDILSAMAVDSNDDLYIVGETQGAFSGYDNSAGELSTSTYYYSYYYSGCFWDIWIAKYMMPTPSPTSIAPTSPSPTTLAPTLAPSVAVMMSVSSAGKAGDSPHF